MPLTLVHNRDENGNRWRTGMLPSPDHAARRFKGYSEVAAVTWVQCGVCNPGRAERYHWLEFSSGRSLSLRYKFAMKANCPLENSLLVLNLLLLQQQCFWPGLQSVLSSSIHECYLQPHCRTRATVPQILSQFSPCTTQMMSVLLQRMVALAIPQPDLALRGLGSGLVLDSWCSQTSWGSGKLWMPKWNRNCSCCLSADLIWDSRV